MPVAHHSDFDTKRLANDNDAAKRVDEFFRLHKFGITTQRGNLASRKCGRPFDPCAGTIPPHMEMKGTTDFQFGVAIRLRAVRYALAGENLSALCREFGWAKSSKWQFWENTRNLPDIQDVLKFKHMYPGFTLDYIFDGDTSGVAHGIVLKLDEVMPKAKVDGIKAIESFLVSEEAKAKAQKSNRKKAA